MNAERTCWILAAALLGSLAGCSSSSSSSIPETPAPLNYSLSTSAASLTFALTAIGSSSTQSVTLTSTGTGPLSLTPLTITGTDAAAFSYTTTCGTALAAGASCMVTIAFTPLAAAAASATFSAFDNGSNSPSLVTLAGTGFTPVYTFTAGVSPTSLTFPITTVGLTSSEQPLSLTNTGTGTLTLSGYSFSGSAFSTSGFSTCSAGTPIPPGSSCAVGIAFTPAGSGASSSAFSFLFTGPGTATPATIVLGGTGTGTASSADTVDCSVNTGYCPATFSNGGQLATDPIAAGLFHGYADPSMRKDPNTSTIYLAYSWARTLSDGTHVVDLHLASSANGGNSFTYVGPLYQSAQTTQAASTAYSSVNDSSTETIDLLPIPLTGASAGQTLWVQAHQSYLVAPQGGIYDQLNATNLISITAVQLANPSALSAGTTLLGLSTAPEARLGAAGTDPSRNITQSLYGLNAATAKCANWGQPALWYQAGTLYLALECTEVSGNGNLDTNELAHFVYSTMPAGANASTWTWAYVGEFATPAQAAKLGALPGENLAYGFFTEPEFVQTKAGQLAVVMTPGVFAPTGSTQPVIQYGCRLVPVTLTPTSVTLDIDSTTGAPAVLAKVTENDLYTSPNEGPAACTYEPAANNGIVMGRKYEDDPTYGFYIYPLNSEIAP